MNPSSALDQFIQSKCYPLSKSKKATHSILIQDNGHAKNASKICFDYLLEKFHSQKHVHRVVFLAVEENGALLRSRTQHLESVEVLSMNPSAEWCNEKSGASTTSAEFSMTCAVERIEEIVKHCAESNDEAFKAVPIFIDSVTSLLLDYSVAQVCSFLQRIKKLSSGAVLVSPVVLRLNQSTVHPNVCKTLESISSVIIQVETQQSTEVYPLLSRQRQREFPQNSAGLFLMRRRNVSGKSVDSVDSFEFVQGKDQGGKSGCAWVLRVSSASTKAIEESKKAVPKRNKENPNRQNLSLSEAASSCASDDLAKSFDNMSFNLSLTEEEKRARDSVTLSYHLKQKDARQERTDEEEKKKSLVLIMEEDDFDWDDEDLDDMDQDDGLDDDLNI